MDDHLLAARKALKDLDGLTETALFPLRRRWIERNLSTAEIRTFVQDATEQAHRAQSAVDSCVPLNDLVRELDALCGQFDYPVRDCWVEVAGALGELSVLLPQARASLLRDADFGDPLGELDAKIAEQRAVVKNLADDLDVVKRPRELHHTAMAKQKILNMLAKYRWRVEGGKLVKHAAAPQATDGPNLDVRDEVIETLAAQLDRAKQRLDKLLGARPTAR